MMDMSVRGLRMAAVLAVVVLLAAGCAEEPAAPAVVGGAAPDSDVQVASVDLSDPARNEALDELDAILDADAGPEQAPEPTRPSAPVPAPVPDVPAPTETPTEAPTEEPVESEVPEPTFTPAEAPDRPILLAQRGNTSVSARPVQLNRFVVSDGTPVLAQWEDRVSGEPASTLVVTADVAASAVVLVEPDTGQPLASDRYEVALADGWLIFIEGPFAGQSASPAEGFVLTRVTNASGTTGWYATGDPSTSSFFVFPTDDSDPLLVDLTRL